MMVRGHQPPWHQYYCDGCCAVRNGIGAFDAHTEKKRAANAVRSRFVDQTWIAAQHRYFTAKEAKEFGLVDDVLVKLADEKKDKK